MEAERWQTIERLYHSALEREQKQRAAEAGLDRSAALYRSTVIAAFQNVADVLQAIEADRQLFIAADRGAKAAQVNLTKCETRRRQMWSSW